MFSWILAGSQEAYIEQVDLQTDKNKRKILQLQKENKDKRQKLKELLEVKSNSLFLFFYFEFHCSRVMKKCWTKHSVVEKMNEQR